MRSQERQRNKIEWPADHGGNEEGYAALLRHLQSDVVLEDPAAQGDRLPPRCRHCPCA